MEGLRVLLRWPPGRHHQELGGRGAEERQQQHDVADQLRALAYRPPKSPRVSGNGDATAKAVIIPPVNTASASRRWRILGLASANGMLKVIIGIGGESQGGPG